MKPPVEAPTSSARRPAGSIPNASSAFASLMPPRDTYGGGSATATSASSATSSPGFVAGRPATRTSPAITAAAARERDSYRPRSASRVSSRRLPTRGRVTAGGETARMTTLLVGAAGTLGVLSRYGISRLTLHTDALVWSTVGINIVGSFLLGLLVAEHWFDRDVREAIGVGFLGGFTTFSTFSVQIVLEVDSGEPGRAAGYLLASVIGGVAAATAGYALGRKLA